MKADALKFFVSCFDIPNIYLGRCISDTKIELDDIFLDFKWLEIREPESIFGMPKIADEKLQSVSFHNHLVAR